MRWLRDRFEGHSLKRDVLEGLTNVGCEVLVQIAGTVARTPLCYVAFQVPSTAFQTAGTTRPRTPNHPSANWPLRMRCIISMPAIVIAAFLNRSEERRVGKECRSR